MSKTFPTIEIRQGVVYLHGQPRLFISADYPYYRDDAANWKDRLERLKSLGIRVITAYIPWRHHQTDPEAAPDFRGLSAPNRDVLGFLRLCADLDLLVIVKPGPFVHAELNYGGLPDWVCPLNNPDIESLLNAEGKAEQWSGARLGGDGKSLESWPLPAPFSPEFLRLSCAWLERVGEEVIRPNQAPHGPVIAIQIGNEGIYSNGQHAPWAYDYSPSALAKFAAFLEEKYRTLETYNALYGTHFRSWQEIPAPWQASFPLSVQQARMLEDWGAFQAWYMDAIFRTWAETLGTSLPVLVNQNPPLDAPFGLDAWLTRVEPERWKGVHYGFTNWLGDVSAKPSAFERYLLTAKRFPGPNMEENWGFAELYDPAYVDASTSFYQTLAILNSGATGFNVYTGVGTAHADRNLELIQKVPYPDAAPITADGALTPKAEIVRWLVTFFERHGADFLACRTTQPVAWGLYLPHARLAAWSPENNAHAPRHGVHLREFQRQMRRLQVDYAVVNLETVSVEELRRHSFVFLAGGERMGCDVQQKLAEYTRSGGKLIFLEHIPRLDENGAPCEILWEKRDILLTHPASGYAALLGGVPRPFFYDGEADIWVRSHPERDLHFVTVLIPAHGKSRLEAALNIGALRYHLRLSAAPAGGALLRIENGRITDAIIKGHNAYLGQSVVPQCWLDDQIIGLEEPGDLFLFDSALFRLIPEKTTEKIRQ